MTDILFTHSYFYRFDPKQWKTAQPYPPYGTMYAAAAMRECGFEVKIFDTALRHSPSELLPVLEKERPRYLVIYDDGFNYLTKMCLTRMREAAFEMARMGKAAGCTVIVSSSDSTDHWEQYLAEGVDFVILGEGEATLRELIFVMEGEVFTDFSKILGIAYQTSNPEFLPVEVISLLPEATASKSAEVGRTSNFKLQTQPRPVLHDLDSLPDPAWDLVDLGPYRQIWMRAHGYWTLNLATTRGCPYKCNWCAKPIYGNRYNSRSPERVAAEIEMLTAAYGVRHFWMADDIFGLKPGWVQRFRDVVQERGLRFEYKIQSRVDLLLKEDTMDALVASGLRQVWVGAESGSQKILDAMDKGTTVEEIHEATALLKRKGIEVCFFLQFGYLGETKEDIAATVSMVETLLPHDIGISVSYPLPGTKFYDKVQGTLGEKQNWAVSDDLTMMYPATFPPAYYRRLHRWVHKRFRLRQGLAYLFQAQPLNWRNLCRALLVLYYAPAATVDHWRLRLLEKK